mmetsp:Transcript_6754/g.12104  ORF Transcript_6754/g.12104 Transcript_6754/m.12104 type:complete len:101 (-) Transcript_6754:32-334(-)
MTPPSPPRNWGQPSPSVRISTSSTGIRLLRTSTKAEPPADTGSESGEKRERDSEIKKHENQEAKRRKKEEQEKQSEGVEEGREGSRQGPEEGGGFAEEGW